MSNMISEALQKIRSGGQVGIPLLLPPVSAVLRLIDAHSLLELGRQERALRVALARCGLSLPHALRIRGGAQWYERAGEPDQLPPVGLSADSQPCVTVPADHGAPRDGDRPPTIPCKTTRAAFADAHRRSEPESCPPTNREVPLKKVASGPRYLRLDDKEVAWAVEARELLEAQDDKGRVNSAVVRADLRGTVKVIHTADGPLIRAPSLETTSTLQAGECVVLEDPRRTTALFLLGNVSHYKQTSLFGRTDEDARIASDRDVESDS